MTNSALLPNGYEELSPFISKWALETEVERFRARLASDLTEIRVFYDAIFPHMDAIMVFLADYPASEFRDLPKPVENLYRLALAYMEVSHPIDLRWQGNDIDDAFPPERVIYPLNLG